ncbi:hypothetical protein FHR75_000446 [Kineococcus radiotolerans]|uniref:Uncharacterized protein n=2 Tax=Kineococcus radiotolerans TaxID=131568 RepID=A6W8J2_KINRD|nr:hypothetical protein [Kineococcus radiotolerans]ABS03131.1 hypothetical protein Krad_1645 [Kineococcus radiotolerans SRS30216 = ATCC BAA-149]MBB2899658.1 hypothetical protein [Kineococcus radiotolerans]
MRRAARGARRTAGGDNPAVGLAGWVFADALLALTIIGLAAGGAVHAGIGESKAVAATVAPAVVQPTPAPTVTVTAPAPAPVEAPPMPAGVAQAPVVVSISVDGTDDEAVRAAVAGAVGELAAQGRRAAFVLTFGTATSPGAGTALARRVNAQLDVAAPAVFAGSAKRDFWRAVNADSPHPGVVQLELYLIQ